MCVRVFCAGCVMEHNYSLQRFPLTSHVSPPLRLGEEEARSVSLVQRAKMSPQPFQKWAGGNGVKAAICQCDIWGGRAIYVRSCWKKVERRSRHITAQSLIGWAYSLTSTANTFMLQWAFLFCACASMADQWFSNNFCECAPSKIFLQPSNPLKLHWYALIGNIYKTC